MKKRPLESFQNPSKLPNAHHHHYSIETVGQLTPFLEWFILNSHPIRWMVCSTTASWVDTCDCYMYIATSETLDTLPSAKQPQGMFNFNFFLNKFYEFEKHEIIG